MIPHPFHVPSFSLSPSVGCDEITEYYRCQRKNSITKCVILKFKPGGVSVKADQLRAEIIIYRMVGSQPLFWWASLKISNLS